MFSLEYLKVGLENQYCNHPNSPARAVPRTVVGNLLMKVLLPIQIFASGALASILFYSCNTAPPLPNVSNSSNLVWGMQREQVQEHLKQRNLREVKNYLSQNPSPQAVQEALQLGPLYTIALIFAEEKEWDLYRRTMMAQSYSGSEYAQKIALQHMSEHKVFSNNDRLYSLARYLKNWPQDRKQLVSAVSLALTQGKVELAEKYWKQFESEDLSLEEAILGLKLALLRRNHAAARDFMSKAVLDFPTVAAHKNLWKELSIRPEWQGLLREIKEGPLLLQSLAWKVALLQKEFSATLPVLFQRSTPQNRAGTNGKEVLSKELRFWWSHHTLIEDSGRAMISANNYRSQSRNVEAGRKRLESLLDGETALILDPAAYNSLAYWFIRNQRNYANMEKYRSRLRDDDSLRPWLLVQYLYYFKNAKHWESMPAFLRSWQQERPDNLSLSRSSRRLFSQIYRDMFLRKKVSLLRQLFEAALVWGEFD
ncbi:MAG: hypothetical protein AAF975_06705, partial [Spirochaetota bacterium]